MSKCAHVRDIKGKPGLLVITHADQSVEIPLADARAILDAAHDAIENYERNRSPQETTP
ncbi:hypothetical protein [Pseudoclavibacter sp. VKM Ac-2867]|uniref:hypothetical protein n=1 Tax=Pseudoclavibacter sp. VKM Ac-2867 TaxID=2783829 RepID=UPI00188D2AFB|nr:hypothetical protein [Pseudoclavibacter sp. VKM Ac-2867]MBF4458356.1 hypothetical protein [Pseudoclavibacter sp. VKM Ac-2867]